MGVCIKEVRIASMGVAEIVFFRSLLSLGITLMSYRWTRATLLGSNRGLLLVRGLSGFTALFLYVYAIGMIPYAEAATLLYTSPIFTALFAAWFLREAMPRTGYVALVLCLVGSALILRPEFEGDWVGGACALAAGVLSGVAYTSVRALSKTDANQTIVLSFVVVSVPLSALLMIDDFFWPNAAQWVWLLGVGGFAQMGQVYLTKALRAEKAGPVTMAAFLTLGLSAVWGGLLFGEQLDPLAGLGMLGIIAGIAVLSLRVSRTKRVAV